MKKIVSIALAISMFFALSVNVFAYQTLDHKITSKVTFVPSSSFGLLSRVHMGQAVALWNSASGSTLMAISLGTHSGSGYPIEDGNNYIYKEDAGADYVAQCTYWWNNSGSLTESDININSYYSWANSAQADCYDLFSVFLHETGHTAGLADLYSSSDSAAVMYGYSDTNTTKRALTDDDKAGIKHIYG